MAATSLGRLVRRLQARDARLPLSVSLQLTHRCNLVCTHCLNRLPMDSPRTREELSTAQWTRLLEQSAAEGALFVTFTGGEPLLRPDFAALWRHASQLGLVVDLFTNGTLITDELARLLARHPPNRVSVTLYGASAETYGRVTGEPGALAQVLHGVGRLRARGVPLELKALLTRDNIHDFEAMRALARPHGGLRRWDAELFAAEAGAGGMPRRVALGAEQIAALDRADPQRLQEWRQIARQGKRPEQRPDSPFRCRAGQSGFTLDPWGRMRACSMLREPSVDLRRATVRRAWRELLPRELARLAAQRSTGACDRCADAVLCRVCPARAQSRGQAPATPNPSLCELGRHRRQMLARRTSIGESEESETRHVVPEER